MAHDLTPASFAPAQPLRYTALSGAVVFLTVLAAIFLSGVILQIGVTPDFPWLLASGDWILLHRQLPTKDLSRGLQVIGPGCCTNGASRRCLPRSITWPAMQAWRLSSPGPCWSSISWFLFITSSRRTPVTLVAVIAAATLVVITVNVSIRPMIVTSARAAAAVSVDLSFAQTIHSPAWSLRCSVSDLSGLGEFAHRVHARPDRVISTLLGMRLNAVWKLTEMI